jgi:hypothetical protein
MTDRYAAAVQRVGLHRDGNGEELRGIALPGIRHHLQLALRGEVVRQRDAELSWYTDLRVIETIGRIDYLRGVVGKLCAIQAKRVLPFGADSALATRVILVLPRVSAALPLNSVRSARLCAR